MNVGDVVTVSITASEAGLTLNAGTINGVAVTNFTDNGAGNYSATIRFLKVILTVPQAIRSQSLSYWKILRATRVIRSRQRSARRAIQSTLIVRLLPW